MVTGVVMTEGRARSGVWTPACSLFLPIGSWKAAWVDLLSGNLQWSSVSFVNDFYLEKIILTNVEPISMNFDPCIHIRINFTESECLCFTMFSVENKLSKNVSSYYYYCFKHKSHHS